MSYDRGDTARVKTSITDIDDNPADPIELVFRVLKPSGTEISHTYAPESGAIVRTAKGDYYIDVPLDEVGDWPYRWEGSGGVGVAEEDVLTVHRSAFELAASGILSLAEYKLRRQLTEASPERDEAIEAALASAEDAILQYTGRDFTMAQIEEQREFPWEIHTTILETDDFVGKPSKISFEVPGVGGATTFPTSAYWLGPREGQTYYYIDFTPAKNLPSTSIGAMGFTRNLDTYFSRGGGVDIVTAKVTAKFGWPGAAPPSIKQAVTWLVDEFYKKEGTQGELQAEAIANLSYVYQRAREEQHELPARVMALLDPYRRIAL
jgi:hypothetical protein